MPTPKLSNDVMNFYEHKDVKNLLPQYHNPNEALSGIRFPSRIGVIGSSSSGKTNWLISYLARANDTFGFIHIVCKMKEPLYEFLEKKIGAKYIKFYTNLSELPTPNDIPHKDKQQLIIFDDQVNEKNQQLISEYFVRGRKVGLGLSLIYISQDFHKIPTIIRRQFNFLILLKLSSNRDLNAVLRDFSYDKGVRDMYKEATRERFNFFKIDIDNPNDNKRFSHNWTDYFEVER